jgi:hypothetical protein
MREKPSASTVVEAPQGRAALPIQLEKPVLDNETHVHPRTPSVKSSVGEALQSGRSAADRESARDAERTVKSARPAFGGCNVSYAAIDLATAGVDAAILVGLGAGPRLAADVCRRTVVPTT